MRRFLSPSAWRRRLANLLLPRADRQALALSATQGALLENPQSVATEAMQRTVVERFYHPEVGKDYAVDRAAKEHLVDQFKEITERVPSGTSWLIHVVLAQAIMEVPRAQEGIVVECGVYKGASSCSLSLVCDLVGRSLLCCDSFEGLPEDERTVHYYPHLNVYGYYKPGMYEGTLEEVKSNIETYGKIDACRFAEGYFCDSLPALDEPIAFIFLDVDLATSIRDCIRHLWPLLIEGGFLYTDDSCDMRTVETWFDKAWWREQLDLDPPGYVGAGCGLPLSPAFSAIGYTRKVTEPEKSCERIGWLHYPDEESDRETAT